MRKIILILLFITTKIFAQLEIGSLTTSGQKITENAIKGSISIIKQSYQVKNKKNGKSYGRNGRKDFGHTFSITIKTNAGLVLNDLALKPWLYDNAFKKVENDYEPFISLTEIRDIEEGEGTDYSQCPLKMIRNQPDGIWIANSEKIAPNSMEVDKEEGIKDGWMIWYISKQDLDSVPGAKISIQSANKKIEIKKGAEDMDIGNPIGTGTILGGIYVSPHYKGGGHVSYQLVGVAIKEENQWKLRTPFIDYMFEQGTTSQDTTSKPGDSEDDNTQDDIELTPIGKKEKKNKK